MTFFFFNFRSRARLKIQKFFFSACFLRKKKSIRTFFFTLSRARHLELKKKMGQSFVLVDITKKKYVSPHAWGRGYKLREFAFSFDTFAVLYGLLRESPGRVAFVDDNAMDEEDDEKRGLAPTNDEIDAEYRVLDMNDLREFDGLRGLHRLGTEVARSSRGEQIDRSKLPGRVIFFNRSKRTFFVVDTKDVDQFTVAALVWFLVDTSTASADYIVDVDASARTLEDDALLERHGGIWAYDSISAMNDSVFSSGSDERGESDATDDLRAVAAAFRRRNDPDAPPGKRQRTIAIAPRDDTAPAATAHERIRALCDEFTDKLRSRDFAVERLFQIVHSAHRIDGYVGDFTYVTGGDFRFLSAALLMALEQCHRDDGGVERLSRNLRVVECVLSAFASPSFEHERSTGKFRTFGERAVLFAKHCRVPLATYKRVCAAFDIDEAAAYRLDLQYARLEQAGCLIVPGTGRSLRNLFPLPGSSEERDGDHLKTLVDTHRSFGNPNPTRGV